MSSVLFVAPLLASYLLAPAQTREVHGRGVVARVVASEEGHGRSSAQVEMRRGRRTQLLAIEARGVSAAMLLRSIELVDANFDGNDDLVVLREFGAKWSASDVFLFDAKSGRFSNASPLARSLSRLANATFDGERKTITTRDIGPSNPSRITYAVDASDVREIDACRFLNPIDARVGTLVRSRGTHATFTKVSLGMADVDPCGP